MYRVTFELNAFNGTRDAEESLVQLAAMLECLVAIDVEYLRRRPTVPLLYQSGVRYEEEPLGAEFWRDIPTVMKYGSGDCLPLSTLVLRDDYTFAPIIALKPGDRIMGDGEFTTVLDVAVTGRKVIRSFGLDNGCVLRTSTKHRMFRRDDREVRASHVKVGDDLRTPSRPFPSLGEVQMDARLSAADTAWLIGTHVADGWSEDYRFAISGDDANPKRRKLEQKQRVVDICTRAGIATRWAKKYVSVHDADLAKIMRSCGSYAPLKRVPTMSWSLEQVRELVAGLQTDCSTASSGTLTYGTTSRQLALQLRILHRMLGESVHVREWSASQHKGLGSNSIYRVGIRRRPEDVAPGPPRRAAERRQGSVRVRSVTHEARREVCCDITTDTGRFYLPESDVLVHNCEDLACWLAAEKRVRFGLPASVRILPQLAAPTPQLPDGSFVYHIVVATPDVPGGIDDPSRRLGMR